MTKLTAPMTDMTEMLAALNRIETVLNLILAALTAPNTPRSYRTVDADNGVDAWLKGRS